VRGLHGLSGRPSFGRAILEYAVSSRRSGYSAKRSQERDGAGPA